MFFSWLLPVLIACGWMADISNGQDPFLVGCTTTDAGTNFCVVNVPSPLEFIISGSQVTFGTESYLFADCATLSFTPSCQCYIVIGEVKQENFCKSCDIRIVESPFFQVAFDCSNVIDGPCVGATTEGTCISDEPMPTVSPTPEPTAPPEPEPTPTPTDEPNLPTAQEPSGPSTAEEPTSPSNAANAPNAAPRTLRPTVGGASALDTPRSGSIGLPLYYKNGGWMLLLFLVGILG